MENTEDIKHFKSIIYWIIGVVIALSIGAWIVNTSIKTVETGIIRYEEYQEIHNTITKLNSDLCNMKNVPETDKMFEQFSKAQRINTLKSQMDRWIEEYNAKSKMINRSIWKSSELPYQLSSNQYNCY